MDLFFLILIFIVSIFTSFISTMVGSGGLISIPVLLFFGFSAPMAIATHRLGSLGLHLGSLTRFWNENKIRWNYVLPLLFLDLLSAFVGANLLINADSNLLAHVLGFILLILLPLTLLSKDFGVIPRNVSTVRKLVGCIPYFLVGIWGGFFGGGAGTLIYWVYIYFFGFTLIEASATDKIPGFLSGVLAVFLFGLNNLIDFQVGFVMLVAMIIGSYLGAHVALKQGNAWLKGLFAVVVFILAVKLIFFK